MKHGVRLAIAFLVAAGCSAGPPGATLSSPIARPAASTPPYSLYVADVDGPPVDLLIDGHLVAEVSCSGYTWLHAGVGSVPQLPWSLDVRRQGGGLLQHFDVVGGQDFTLLLRGDTIALGQFGSAGPSSAPSACLEWSR
jgi:hypothetical protein